MPTLVWKDSMNVGVHLIDEQHKGLVELINTLSDAVENGTDRDTVSRLIRNFFEYTATHFRTEESLMDHFTYKHYYEQVYEHLNCSLKALEFHRQFAHDDDFDVSEFFAYISTWFVEHTARLDQTLGEHLRVCGLNAPDKGSA